MISHSVIYRNSIVKLSCKFEPIRAIRVNLLETAIRQMIIYHTGSLHVGVTYGRAEKLEAAFFHILADGVGDGGTCGYCGGVINNRFAIGHKAVQVFVK